MPSSYVSHMEWIYDKAKVVGRRQNGELVSRRILAHQYDYVYRELGPNGQDPYGPFTRDRLVYETERRLHDYYWGNVGPPFPGVRPGRPQPSRAAVFRMPEPAQAQQAPQVSQASQASQAFQASQAYQARQVNAAASSSSRSGSSYAPRPQANDGTGRSSAFASNVASYDPRQAASASTHHTEPSSRSNQALPYNTLAAFHTIRRLPTGDDENPGAQLYILDRRLWDQSRR